MFNKNLNKNTILIILGDFGSNYYLNKKDLIFKEKLEKYNIIYFIIRGNHEYRPSECAAGIAKNKNKTTWKNKIFFDNDVLYEEEFPSILYAKDGPAIYNINGHKTLVLPGAYSVDKYYRLETHRPWNPQEQLTSKEQLNLINLVNDCNHSNIPIDFVIGHTFPLYIEPYYKHLFLDFIDQSSVDKATEKFLNNLSFIFEQNFAFKHYFGGHFHSDIYNMKNKYTMLYYDVVDIDDYI
jgi:3-oxoacid CoA-transferase subunit A